MRKEGGVGLEHFVDSGRCRGRGRRGVMCAPGIEEAAHHGDQLVDQG